jgi:hypothetical protein
MDMRQFFVGSWGMQEILQRQLEGCETALEQRPALAPRPQSRRSGTHLLAVLGEMWRMRRREQRRTVAPVTRPEG